MPNKTFEIKIAGKDIPAQVIMLLKRETNQSIAEIKTKINDNEPFFGCALNDNEGLSLLIKIGEYLQASNVDFKTLYNGRVEDLEVLKNVLNSHRDTAREVGFEEDEIDY